MFQRVVVGVTGVPLVILIALVFPPVCMVIVLSLLCALAVYECLYATSEVTHRGVLALSTVLAALVPFWCYFSMDFTVAFSAVFVYFLLLGIMAMRSDRTLRFGQMGIALYGALMVPLMLSALVLIRDMDHGRYFVLLPCVSAFSSDVFALFAGMTLGKHKLAPKLSPKKTIEGSVGGILGAGFMCVLYGLIIRGVWGVNPNLLGLFAYGIVASPIAQLGDLNFSYIKRESGIKDYGNLFPGHGGVLDRFDSVIFCAPFTYIVIRFVELIRF